VLSSIHANDAVGVLFRLMDLGVETSSISSTLIGIASQRMVRRICSNCKTSYQPTGEERELLLQEPELEIGTLYHGTGCNLCAGTGYSGRTGIFELLAMSESIRKMLRSGASASEIKAQAVAEGMVTMKRDGMLKVKDGVTSLTEVTRSVFSIT
jgi:general secretion pathway protein E